MDKDRCPYRLGDMVKVKLARGITPCGAEGHIRLYPDSLTSRYLEAEGRSDETKDIDIAAKVSILSSVVQAYALEKDAVTPKEDDLVVHLRLGDVVELTSYPLEYGVPGFLEPVEHYIQRIEELAKLTPLSKRVVLVYGSHVDALEEKSKAFITAVVDGIAHLGLVVEHRSETADDDFVFISNARRLVVSGGGYSDLAGNVAVKLQDANVAWTRWNTD